MNTINPILEAEPFSGYSLEVPQYILDVREVLKNSKKKFKRMKSPKTKISKQKTVTYKNLSLQQFSSFIDTSHPKSPESSTWGKKHRSIGQIARSAEKDLKELIEIAKIAGEDVYYELIDLKKKELGLIYNYLKQK